MLSYSTQAIAIFCEESGKLIFSNEKAVKLLSQEYRREGAYSCVNDSATNFAQKFNDHRAEIVVEPQPQGLNDEECVKS